MIFSLIVCTYNRPAALMNLLKSLKQQSLYPNEVIIIDGSENNDTEEAIHKIKINNILYYRVGENHRGLTRQRNYGVERVHQQTEVICFLDDDIVLEPDYFSSLISTYKTKPEAIAAGGWIIDNTHWEKANDNYKPDFNEFYIDGYVRKLGQRNVLRKTLGLLSDKPPGFMPEFSHGFSTGFLPPSGKIYEVEFFMGGVSSYKRSLFQKISFSSYFEGYGLYEDMDFCLRASKIGKLYVNTDARVLHFHEESGRPDYFKYGKMVIENGFYVWKLKYPKSGIKAKIKYIFIDITLMLIRLVNGVSGDKNGIKDSLGRLCGLWNSLINKKFRDV